MGAVDVSTLSDEELNAVIRTCQKKEEELGKARDKATEEVLMLMNVKKHRALESLNQGSKGFFTTARDDGEYYYRITGFLSEHKLIGDIVFVHSYHSKVWVNEPIEREKMSAVANIHPCSSEDWHIALLRVMDGLR